MQSKNCGRKPDKKLLVIFYVEVMQRKYKICIVIDKFPVA